AKTTTQGAPTWKFSESITTQAKFSKCLTVAKFSPKFAAGITTTVNSRKPMEFTYLPNAPGKGAPGQVIISEGSAKIGSGVCTFHWGGQTIFSKENLPAATFETTLKKQSMTGLHEYLVVNNSFRGIEWEYEEGQC